MHIPGSSALLIWVIAGTSIFMMLLRPRGLPEYVWVGSGATLLVLLRLVPLNRAVFAVREGVNVYLFLTGMMLLADLARQEGVFEWVADAAVEHAGGSAGRLLLLVYLTGTVVTALMSNDATAVVLTPAVLAAVRRARVNPLPHLLACAFVANAASFVFPISNPANLVIYGKNLPELFAWLRIFWLASSVSILATFFCLRVLYAKVLRGRISQRPHHQRLTREGRLALGGLVLAAAILLSASGFGIALGLPTCIAALIALLMVGARNYRVIPRVMKDVSWGVIPLVAGLFVIVEGLRIAGLLHLAERGVSYLSQMEAWTVKLGAGFAVALLSNVMNNLPVALAGGTTLQQSGHPALLTHAVLLGVDIGPNLSVTGSLATILWLIALRRENVEITAWQFFRVGVLVMPVALFLTLLVVR
jgi:arsenical pump membrane protein